MFAKQKQQDTPKRKAPQFPLSEAAEAKAEVRKAAPAPVAKESTPRLPKEPKEPKAKVTRPCLCGCGRQVARKFAQGHDAKLKGMLQRSHAECVHPNDTPLPRLIANFEEVTGTKVKAKSAMGLVEALNPAWEVFLTEFRRPGSKRVAKVEIEEAEAV